MRRALPGDHERERGDNLRPDLDEHPYVPAGVLRVRVTPRRRGGARGRGRGRGCGRARGRGRGRGRGGRGRAREREEEEPPRQRARLRRIEESTTSSGGSDVSDNGSGSDSSEEEFTIEEIGGVSGNGIGVRYPSYLNRRVSVPGSYFQDDSGGPYTGVCKRWGRYENNIGERVYGYLIHYNDGDKFWMLEKNVHLYVVEE